MKDDWKIQRDKSEVKGVALLVIGPHALASAASFAHFALDHSLRNVAGRDQLVERRENADDEEKIPSG